MPKFFPMRISFGKQTLTTWLRIGTIFFIIACVIYFVNYNASQQKRKTKMQVKSHGLVNEQETKRFPLSETGNEVLQDAEHREWEKSREAVKAMMKHAWYNYKKFAWGYNELRSDDNNLGSHAGADGLVGYRNGLTIIDSLSTLYIMGLYKEFEDGKQWVAKEFSFCKTSTPVSVFEVTIRLLGGLLSAFSFSKDPIFAKKAIDVGECLRGAFNTVSGIPSKTTVPTRKQIERSTDFSTTLADAGTLDLEFTFLSEISGNDKYKNLVSKTRESLEKLRKKSPTGLLPNTISISTNSDQQFYQDSSLGGGGDSYYEYQVKRYAFNRTERDRKLFVELLEKAKSRLIVEDGNMTCAGPKDSSCNMEHLACFTGGMYALAGQFAQSKNQEWLKLAEGITKTCYESYSQSPLHVGQESFVMDKDGKIIGGDGRYLLRPEVMESIYYMYHFTGDVKYRKWAQLILQGLNDNTKLKHGFSGVQYSRENGKLVRRFDFVQQSFFMAETLKYLYMVFQEPRDRLDLNRWVLTTEAHPIPTMLNPLMKQLKRFQPFLTEYMTHEGYGNYSR